jgi:hypothetical protein
MSNENKNNNENIEQEDKINKNWLEKLLGLNQIYKLAVLNYWHIGILVEILVIIFIFLFIFNYSFIVNKICFSIESYCERKHDFKNQEKILRLNIFLQDNILGKNTKYYQYSLKNIIYFYEKQWIFDKAEYWQRKYLKNITDITDKQIGYKDLSYYLQSQKKYQEAIDCLKKGEMFTYYYTKNNNLKNFFLLDWNFYFAILYLDEGKITIADEYKYKQTNNQNSSHYYIKKYMKLKQYKEAKNAIEYEYVYNPNGIETDVLSYSGNYKYRNLIEQEQYRNILRAYLLKIYISEKNENKIVQLLNDIQESEFIIYGYYSPENLCNVYNNYKILDRYETLKEIEKITSKLIYFQDKNKQNLLVNVSTFCSKKEVFR